MTITYRTIKGSELTYAEVDENFATITAQYDSVVAAVGDVNQSAANAANSAAAAAASETSAFNSASSATASQVAVTDLYDQFDDRYLGSKDSAPTLDNDGNALLTGALYWNSVSNKIFVWTGSMWADVVAANASTVQFTPTGGVAATNVQAAIAEIDTDKAPINSPSFSGSPSSPTPAQFDSDTSIATTEFVQRALGNLSGETTITATGSLASSQVGDYVNVSMSSAGQTVSLPAANSVPRGSQYTLINLGQSYSLSRSGSDILSTNGSTSTTLAIPVGGSVFAISNGGNTWLIGGSGVVGLQGDFGSSLADSGYQRLPSGLIVQWGRYITTANSSQSITLPIAFPTGTLTFNVVKTNGTSNAILVEGSFDFTSKTVIPINMSSATAGIGVTFIAIGY